MYHFGPRFMYEYSSVTSVSGETIRFLRLVSLWKTILLLMSSFRTENWLDHDFSELLTYLYMTISSGRPSMQSCPLRSVARAASTYLSSISILLSILCLAPLAIRSVSPALLFPASENTKNAIASRKVTSEVCLSMVFLSSIYSWWYGSPLIMVKALYNCSVNIALTIWCENVIFEREIFELALL